MKKRENTSIQCISCIAFTYEGTNTLLSFGLFCLGQFMSMDPSNGWNIFSFAISFLDVWD